jgi:uncharacterized protein
MGNPIVHAEIVGPDPARLRDFYRELFGWEAEPGAPVAAAISEPADYAFVEPGEGGAPVPAGIGGGRGFAAHAVFYVGVPDVRAALARAVELGGTVEVAPDRRPDGAILVAQFRDPEGSLVGLAGPA